MNLLLDNPICSGHLYCVNTGQLWTWEVEAFAEKVLFELGFDKGWDFLLVNQQCPNEFTNEHIMQNQKRILQQEEDSKQPSGPAIAIGRDSESFVHEPGECWGFPHAENWSQRL